MNVSRHPGQQIVPRPNPNLNVTSTVNQHYMTHALTGQQISPNGPRIPAQRQARNMVKNQMDPFGRVNSKARKVIESVERQRQTPADPRAGSTGGSFDEELEFGQKI